jgi:sugar lactone lactonase YvrE
MGGWLLVDNDGCRLLHVDRSGRVIWQTGGARRAETLTAPSALAVERSRLVVADAGADRLVVFDLAGNLLSMVTSPPAPIAIAAGASQWWIASWASDRIHAIDASSGAVVAEHEHLEVGAPAGLVVAAGGTLVVTERWLGRVHAFDQTRGWIGMVETADGLPLGTLGGLAALDDGGVVVTDVEHGWIVELEMPLGGGRGRVTLDV